MKLPTRALAALVLLACTAPLAAQDGKDLAKQAKAVLEKHCYECHGKNGKAEEGIFVLSRERLVNRKKLVPGNAAKSKLYESIDRGRMPPAEKKVRLTKEEMEAIRAWIAADAPDFQQAPPKRTFIRNNDILAAIEADLQAANPRSLRELRYVTITHLYNAGVSDDELEQYRRGLSKLLNSLSWGKVIVKPQTIDDARTIFRIDLRDFEWEPATWQAILKRYPYGLTEATTAARYVQRVTGSPLPYVRGDWFVYAASRPPLYHDVLRIPHTDLELEKRLEIDAANNIRRDKVWRAGFNRSAVSRNNRLLERHRSQHGAYWKSYDFISNDGRRNLFRHPLGPAGEEAFEADGGEIIFNLPNGLQGYMLTDGKGRRIDEGPIKVVSTGDRRKPEVINGISCMSCHKQGMIPKDDQVRKAVLKSAAFSQREKDTVQALYPEREVLDRLYEEDAERFKKAVEETGDSVQQSDTVVLLASRFEEEIELKQAAAELGLEPVDLLRKLDRSIRVGRALAPLGEEGGTVKRDAFEESFAIVVEDLGLGTYLPPREILNSIDMALVRIAAGSFLMGSPSREKERHLDEPLHEVEITREFYLGACEVTQKQFKSVMGYNPSCFSLDGAPRSSTTKYGVPPGKWATETSAAQRAKVIDTDSFPVENVSWHEAVEFCKKLTERERKEGKIRPNQRYRLPREAEWEYACRAGAGTQEPFHCGNAITSARANFKGTDPYAVGGEKPEKGEYLARTCRVGSYPPNSFGLHDMHGNIYEWCEDWYSEDYYKVSPKTDPAGPTSASGRKVSRGGCYANPGAGCRAAARKPWDPTLRAHLIGFRVALVTDR